MEDKEEIKEKKEEKKEIEKKEEGVVEEEKKEKRYLKLLVDISNKSHKKNKNTYTNISGLNEFFFKQTKRYYYY
jgi:hypothetical protein